MLAYPNGTYVNYNAAKWNRPELLLFLTQPKFGPRRPNPNMDPGGQARPKVEFIEYIIFFGTSTPFYIHSQMLKYKYFGKITILSIE